MSDTPNTLYTLLGTAFTVFIGYLGIRHQTKGDIEKAKLAARQESDKAQLVAEQERQKLAESSEDRDARVAKELRDELRSDLQLLKKEHRDEMDRMEKKHDAMVSEIVTTHDKEMASQEARFREVLQTLREDRDGWKKSYEELWVQYGELRSQHMEVLTDRDRLVKQVSDLNKAVMENRVELERLKFNHKMIEGGGI